MEFFQRGERAVFFDVLGGVAESLERAVAFDLEGFVVEQGERFDLLVGFLEDLEGLVVGVLVHGEHGAGDGVHAEDVGPPLFEVLAVLFALGVMVDEVEEPEVAPGVANGAAPVLELEQVEVPAIVEDAFVEEFAALGGGEPETVRGAGGAGAFEPGELKVEDGFLVVGAEAVGTAVDFVLLDTDREPDLEQFTTVGGADDAAVVGRVELPGGEDCGNILVVVHDYWAASTCQDAGRFATGLAQPLMPVVAMPSMKRFWARKNNTITGTIITVVTAITSCHGVPSARPQMPMKFTRPIGNVKSRSSWR